MAASKAAAWGAEPAVATGEQERSTPSHESGEHHRVVRMANISATARLYSLVTAIVATTAAHRSGSSNLTA